MPAFHLTFDQYRARQQEPCEASPLAIGAPAPGTERLKRMTEPLKLLKALASAGTPEADGEAQCRPNTDRLVRMLALASSPELRGSILTRIDPDDALSLAEEAKDTEIRDLLITRAMDSLDGVAPVPNSDQQAN
jgi:hypothetical protein